MSTQTPTDGDSGTDTDKPSLTLEGQAMDTYVHATPCTHGDGVHVRTGSDMVGTMSVIADHAAPTEDGPRRVSLYRDGKFLGSVHLRGTGAAREVHDFINRHA